MTAFTVFRSLITSCTNCRFASEVTTAAAPESFIMCLSSCFLYITLRGTVTPPHFNIPKWAIANSGEFCMNMQTRSPLPTPNAESALANLVESESSSPKVYTLSFHFSATLAWNLFAVDENFESMLNQCHLHNQPFPFL